MKILLTGFNKNQNVRKFYLRQQLKVVPSHYSLFNCLFDMGHEVEQRQVQIGDDLSDYDEVIAFIAGPRQLVATSVYEGLYAVAARPDCILAVDDWQASDLFKAVAKCEEPRELFAKFILDTNKKELSDIEQWESMLLDGVRQITSKQNRMLVSAFQTGHLDSVDYGPQLIFDAVDYPRDRLFVYNPNPYHRNRKWEDPFHEGIEDPSWSPPADPARLTPRPVKERRMNFATLLQNKTMSWLKREGFTTTIKDDEAGEIGSWRVDLYGSNKYTAKRLTEDAMVRIITRDWGCLMPGYEHAGSGWWRARPQQCADARSILLGDEKELRVYYGNKYPFYNLRAEDLAHASDAELQFIADAQATALQAYHPLDRSVQQAELGAALNSRR